jgi:hypothetical protein
MLGLDFADFLTGKMVEVEEAKVRLMGTALVTALQAASVDKGTQRTILDAFFANLRAESERQQGAVPALTALDPRDEDLL